MDHQNNEPNIITKVINGVEVIERKSIRWMMVLYDAILYALCGFFVFVFQPSMTWRIGLSTACFYFFVGAVLFLCTRLLLRCYKQIFRYGSMHAFAREVVADLLGGVLYLGLGLLLTRVFQIAVVPFMFLLSFAALYVLASLIARIAYCQ